MLNPRPVLHLAPGANGCPYKSAPGANGCHTFTCCAILIYYVLSTSRNEGNHSKTKTKRNIASRKKGIYIQPHGDLIEVIIIITTSNNFVSDVITIIVTNAKYYH